MYNLYFIFVRQCIFESNENLGRKIKSNCLQARCNRPRARLRPHRIPSRVITARTTLKRYYYSRPYELLRAHVMFSAYAIRQNKALYRLRIIREVDTICNVGTKSANKPYQTTVKIQNVWTLSRTLLYFILSKCPSFFLFLQKGEITKIFIFTNNLYKAMDLFR